MKFISDLKELNGQVFDNVEDLKAAEAKANATIAAKQKLADEKKKEKKKVEDTIVKRDESHDQNIEKKKRAREEFVKIVEEARKKYDTICDEIDEEENKNNTAVISSVKEFCEKYKQPYHSTITYKDGSTKAYSYSYNTADTKLPSLLDFKTLFWF